MTFLDRQTTHSAAHSAREDPQSFAPMNKLCIFGGTTLGSYVGWFLFERFGLLAAFAGSGVGSILGVYAGWKLARKIDS
jgi:uncharacterized membrane protein YfcA